MGTQRRGLFIEVREGFTEKPGIKSKEREHSRKWEWHFQRPRILKETGTDSRNRRYFSVAGL